MDPEGDAAKIVQELTREGDESLASQEEGASGERVGIVRERPSVDTQNFEVIHEQEPRIVDETPTNGDNGGNLLVVGDQPAAAVATQPTIVDETPKQPVSQGVKEDTTTRQKSPSESKDSDVPSSLIKVKLQIDASMDNDELEAVRQTMTFVLGFYRKWHDEHYHCDRIPFVLSKSARAVEQLPKNDECLPEFHAKVEGVATTYASRLATVALQIEPQLLSKAAAGYQNFVNALADRSEDDIWLAFREQAEIIYKTGESWEKLTVVLLLAYLVCLSEDVRPQKRATGFLRSFIQYLVAERHVRWVSRHGGWANAAWGLRRHRLAKCLCAKSTMYGFVLIAIGVAGAGIFLTKKQHH